MQQDEQLIYSTTDQFGGLRVVEDQQTRKLYFDSNIEQGCLYLQAPMKLAYEYQHILVNQILKHAAHNKTSTSPYRVLMLGLGSGSIAQHLYNSLPNLQMTVIEIRQIVIDCAYRFFHLPEVPEIDVLQVDALMFIKTPMTEYDAIIVDIFDSQGMIPELSAPPFQSDLWKNMKPESALFYHLWYQWNDSPESEALIPTKTTEAVLNYWQKRLIANTSLKLNRYNIRSSQNLVLEITKQQTQS